MDKRTFQPNVLDSETQEYLDVSTERKRETCQLAWCGAEDLILKRFLSDYQSLILYLRVQDSEPRDVRDK